MIVNLLFAFDQNFIRQFICTLRSCVYHHNTEYPLHIYLLYLDQTDQNQSNLDRIKTQLNNLQQVSQKSFQYDIILFDGDRVAKFPIKFTDHVSLATYIRLFIGEYLPTNVDKILYLDCDVIVRQSLHNIFKKDLGSTNYLGAISQGRRHPEKFYKHFFKFKNFNRSEFTVFNAGVLLINLKLWRMHQLKNKFLEFIEQNQKHLRFHDQDVLNCVCIDRWKPLSWKWNYYLNTKHPKGQSIREAKIIHFNSSHKPWNKDYTYDSKKYWMKYWHNYPVENKKNNKKYL